MFFCRLTGGFNIDLPGFLRLNPLLGVVSTRAHRCIFA
jgi:hypothetical protein